nr:MAG TPA: hypothetical protein [Caudoviricetes sp.]
MLKDGASLTLPFRVVNRLLALKVLKTQLLHF